MLCASHNSFHSPSLQTPEWKTYSLLPSPLCPGKPTLLLSFTFLRCIDHSLGCCRLALLTVSSTHVHQLKTRCRLGRNSSQAQIITWNETVKKKWEWKRSWASVGFLREESDLIYHLTEGPSEHVTSMYKWGTAYWELSLRVGWVWVRCSVATRWLVLGRSSNGCPNSTLLSLIATHHRETSGLA